jgi:hypothetical protein
MYIPVHFITFWTCPWIPYHGMLRDCGWVFWNLNPHLRRILIDFNRRIRKRLGALAELVVVRNCFPWREDPCGFVVVAHGLGGLDHWHNIARQDLKSTVVVVVVVAVVRVYIIAQQKHFEEDVEWRHRTRRRIGPRSRSGVFE